MALWKAKTASGVRVFFNVVRNGSLVSGVDPGDFTVTLINATDTANISLSVTESTQNSGTYYVDLPTGFLTTHGANHYGLSVGIHQSAPKIDDEVLFPIEVTTRDLDDLAQPGDAMDLTAAGVDAVWDEDITTHSGANSAGLELQNKAEPGDSVTLVADSIDSTVLATSAVTEIVNAIFAFAVETGYPFDRVMRIISSAVAGKSSGGPGSPIFRDLGDTSDMITGVADTDGNRTSAVYGS